MDFAKIMDIIANSNIDKKEMYELINEASKMNLRDEASIRTIIRKGAKIAKKEISKEKENEIVKLILKEDISPNLFKNIL